MAPVDGHADHFVELKDHQGIREITGTEGKMMKEGDRWHRLILLHTLETTYVFKNTTGSLNA